MENKIIYFDSAAKTIPYEESLNNFLIIYKEYFANPSSIHFEGVKANRIIEKEKDEVLSLLKLKSYNFVLTSSASEANNLAIKGFCLKYKNRGNHIICSAYEHPSVLDVFEQLKNNFGFDISYVYPNEKGIISIESIKKEITDKTILVSIMAVNNEVGAINPISEIANELRKFPKLVFHCDAAQALGKFSIDYSNVDMITISAHKIHGISTCGGLIVKKNLELLPLISGGGQEYGLRSGTVDTASAVSFCKAIKKSLVDMNSHFNSVKPLADKLLAYLKSKPDLFEINSNENNPYIVNFSTLKKKGSVVVEALSSRGILVSSTSACSSHKEKGSYVVASLGKNSNVSNNTIRVSFSYLNTIEEVEAFIKNLEEIIGEIR